MSKSKLVMDAKVKGYSNAIKAQQDLDFVNSGNYKLYRGWNGEQDVYVDQYTNEKDIKGYTIRIYANETGVDYMKIIDKGNGSFDTNGWVEVK